MYVWGADTGSLWPWDGEGDSEAQKGLSDGQESR